MAAAVASAEELGSKNLNCYNYDVDSDGICVEHEIFVQNVKTMIIMMWILMGCELSCDYAPGRQFAFEEEEQKEEQKCTKKPF